MNNKANTFLIYLVLFLGVFIGGYLWYNSDAEKYKRSIKYLSLNTEWNMETVKTWDKLFVIALYEGLKKDKKTIEYKGKTYSTLTALAV
jgi:hypothetical protein